MFSEILSSILLFNNCLFFRKIIKSHKDDSGFFGEKKKYYEENYKSKNEDIKNESKVDEVKKIEFKIMKTTKLSNTNKYFDDLKDELPTKPNKNYMNDSKEDNEIKKKSETLKSEHTENKTSGSSKPNKFNEDNLSADTDVTEINKKNPSDVDKKLSYSKRIDSRRQESKIDRRIRNKDRPAIEIYRPGMGRLSKLKAENDGVESESKN